MDLRADVEALTAPGERMVGRPGHAAAARWLCERLSALPVAGYHQDGFRHRYTRQGETFTNVLATIPGRNPSLPPILLGAHYDTCGPHPGADDNAAAVAILLHAIPKLAALRLRRSVTCAFFDAEEPPHFLTRSMGSIHFYHRQRREPVHCAIVMDLVGHDVPIPGGEPLLFVMGAESDPALLPVVSAMQRPGLAVVATLNRYVGDLSDHHIFRHNQRPYLFLSCGRWQHYHTPSDTAEKLSYAKMARIVDLLVDTTARVSDARLDGPFDGADSLDLERATINQHLGPLLGMRVNTRAQIDTLVQQAMSLFGV